MKLLSLFSGIGAFEKALDNLKIPYELVAYCEIDKYASKSYAAIHGVPESMNLGDITKVDEKALPKDIDLVTYGFPCQDISLAGKQKGLFNEDGTQTRSGLFFEALRIIEETQPRVAIAENVKNLTSKKFNAQFQIVLESLEQAGYNNYWQVLNAKDYGIPQNRERVFIVSIRKDIDTGMFQFPEGFPLELRLKDMLEDVVDEKYYLKSKDTSVFKMFDSISEDTNGCIQVGNLDRPTTHDFSNRVYSPDGLARTLMGSGGNQNDKAGQYLMRIDIPQTVKVRKYPVDTESLCEVLRYHKALVDQNNNGISNALGVPVTKVEHWFRRDDCFAIPDPDVWFKLKELLEITTDEFDEAIMTFEEKEGVYEKSERHYFAEGISPTLTSTSAGNEKFITACAMRGRYNENGKVEQNVEVSDRDYANAITTVQKDSLIADNLEIRKLTPKECFRLMGFDDSDFEKAEAVNSNTQLYKQAGNSIVVQCPEKIIEALIACGALEEEEKREMELKIYNPTEDGFVKAIEWNHEEIKAMVSEKVSYYKGLVYTEDEIKSAKTDRATLNKFVAALETKRKEIKKQCLAPYEDFEKKMKEIVAIVNEPINLIDSQVKAYEEKQKQEKKAKIEEYFAERYLNSGTPAPECFRLERIFDEKWLNASVSMKSIEEAIDAKAEQIKNDLATLSDLPEFGFEATEVYKTTLDLNKALNEGRRLSEIQKRKAEHEAEQARLAAEAEAKKQEEEFAKAMNPPVEEVAATEKVVVPPATPAKQWVSFKAHLTVDQAGELKQFFDDRCIEFEAI